MAPVRGYSNSSQVRSGSQLSTRRPDFTHAASLSATKRYRLRLKKNFSCLSSMNSASQAFASFASDREGCHESQCTLSEGVVSVFGIEHRDNVTFSDSETGVVPDPGRAAPSIRTNLDFGRDRRSLPQVRTSTNGEANRVRRKHARSYEIQFPRCCGRSWVIKSADSLARPARDRRPQQDQLEAARFDDVRGRNHDA
jgi:hypothetical protein